MPERDPFRAAPLPIAPLDEAGRIACLRLIRSENVGPTTFRALVNQRGGAQRALDMLPELSRRGGRRSPLRICPKEDAEAELAAARRVGAQIVFTIEPGYPARLAHIDPPPPMLYVRGRAELASQPAVAIVGARDASSAGLSLTTAIVSELGAAGIVVVSGLARGIDRAAHTASLATGTVAVLATGIDVVYPPEHAELQARIAAEGCLVSENGVGFRPRAQDFPRRNRIVSGIARGVVVVEAARRSGSLITARMAGEQGREVMAVPGHPLDPRAGGVNHLLKEGATLVTEAADVLAAIGFEPGAAARASHRAMPVAIEEPASPADWSVLPLGSADRVRDIVLQQLGPAPVSIDSLIRTSGLQPSDVNGVLVELELAGRIECHGGQLVSRRV